MGAGLCSVCDLDGEMMDVEKCSPSHQADSIDRDDNLMQQPGEDELKKQQEEEEEKRVAQVARIVEERKRQQEEAERQKQQEAERQRQEEAERQEKEKKLAEEQRRREEQRRIEAEARKAEEAKRRDIEEKRVREKKKADGVALKNFLTESELTEVNEKKKGKFGKYSYPLHIAVKKCNTDIVRILLENKADKTSTTSSGQTALEKAKKYDENNSHSEIIRLLSP